MKTSYLIPACFLLLLLSCQKENSKPSVAGSQKSEIVTAHYIGEAYGGGIIFYLDSTQVHGLIAAVQDQGVARWYNGAFIVTGATKLKIGVGFSNTKKIVTAQGTPGRYAARLCTKYTAGDYTKWYLPSLDELRELWKYKDLVGGFTEQFYWASCEDGSIYGWATSFGPTGTSNIFKKDTAFHVRAIRSF